MIALYIWLALGGVMPQPTLATWYGREFQGRRTASGERYDVRGMTAASRTLPFGTRVRVCRVGTRRCVVVRVNDRGIGRRFALDLTPRAFGRLAKLGRGVVEVTIKEVQR